MSGYLAAMKTEHPELRNSTKLKTTTPNFLRNLILPPIFVAVKNANTASQFESAKQFCCCVDYKDKGRGLTYGLQVTYR